MASLFKSQSLNQAADLFHDRPSINTAKAYQEVALEYTYDYMIATSEYAAIIGEIFKWLKAR